MTTVFIVLYESTHRRCCGTEYKSNYTFQYLIWACNHSTNQSALTSLKNTKRQIHPLIPGGSAIRDRWKEPRTAPVSLLCLFCFRQFQQDTDHMNAACQLKGGTPSPQLAFEKVQKPTWEWEMNWDQTWCSGFLSCTFPAYCPLQRMSTTAHSQPGRHRIPS